MISIHTVKMHTEYVTFCERFIVYSGGHKIGLSHQGVPTATVAKGTIVPCMGLQYFGASKTYPIRIIECFILVNGFW